MQNLFDLNKIELYNHFMELHEISGLGKTRLAYLNNAGIFSCEDFINYFPKKYYNFLSPSPFIQDGTYKMVRGMLVETPKLIRISKNFTFISAKFQDSFGNDFTAIWYNQPYVKSVLKETKEYFIYGKDDKKKKNTLVASYFKSVDKADGLGLFPIYKSIENIPSEVIRKSIGEILENTTISSCITDDIEQNFNLMGLGVAYKNIHLPENLLNLTDANDRIVLEKLIPIVYQRDEKNKLGRNTRLKEYYELDNVLNEYKSYLPFTLTDSQNSAIQDIIQDLESPLNMNRLLEGDVGSGKTAVAFFSLFSAFKNGFQSVLLAPTEILAYEHYKLAKEIFKSVFNLNIVYLSSSLSSQEKRQVLSQIKLGHAHIIIGSHSVFSKNVEYSNLGLIVIDEQHKFGVKARGSLQEKGQNVDTLVMSATPIPRSLKLVFEGTLDVSVLSARPHAQNVHTNLLSTNKADDMWKFIDEKLQAGSKVFVVCPKIEETDDDNMVSAKAIYDELKTKLNTSIELVHGKQDRSKSEEMFNSFKNGNTRVLVSTSIIEVGVDAKDADIMVIMNASSFGLASLHQLRGRVGRDGRESYCFCVIPTNVNPNSIERLKFFKNNTDGFKIAEFDLKSRGAGNINGVEQHGIDSSDICGYRIELFEKATNIVNYMKAHQMQLNINSSKYIELAEKLMDSIAMN